MKKMLQKLETVSKSVMAIVTAVGTILGVLLGIYHGIYKLNQTVSNLITSLPIIENNMKFTDIKGLSAQEVYDEILKNKDKFYLISRVENIKNTPTWVHIDVANIDGFKIFNA